MGFRLHGKALSIIRINHGLKASEVAKALNVSSAHISQCEKSKRALSVTKTKQFIELIGISEEEAKEFFKIMNKGGAL